MSMVKSEFAVNTKLCILGQKRAAAPEIVDVPRASTQTNH